MQKWIDIPTGPGRREGWKILSLKRYFGNFIPIDSEFTPKTV